MSKLFQSLFISSILEGTICQLNNDNKDEEENPKRYIQMDSIIDGKDRKVKVFVSIIDYKKAYKAHGSNKILRIKGELDKSGKNHMIYEYENFEILE